ncbi:MAG: hypothetical protein RBG13Loki_3817 [Promethearchaeota archaeon CR_4]|nr:MAG: hypothetical protein RBG13Loki_3817 [Candidatus Lokiarchaeota archaeon CR_4]
MDMVEGDDSGINNQIYVLLETYKSQLNQQLCKYKLPFIILIFSAFISIILLNTLPLFIGSIATGIAIIILILILKRQHEPLQTPQTLQPKLNEVLYKESIKLVQNRERTLQEEYAKTWERNFEQIRDTQSQITEELSKQNSLTQLLVTFFEKFYQCKIALRLFGINIPDSVFVKFREELHSGIPYDQIRDDFYQYLARTVELDSLQLKFILNLDEGLQKINEIRDADENLSKIVKLLLKHEALVKNSITEPTLKNVLKSQNFRTFQDLLAPCLFLERIVGELNEYVNFLAGFSVKWNVGSVFGEILKDKNVIEEIEDIERWPLILSKYPKFHPFGTINTDLDSLLILLFGYLFIKLKMPAIFPKFCQIIKENDRFFVILWQSYQENPDLEQLMRTKISSPDFWKSLLTNFDADPENRKYLEIFKENILNAKIFIKKRDLHANYINKLESRLGFLDYLLKARGDVDYHAIYSFIFNKLISDRNFRLLISSQTHLRPFLLTFGGSAAEIMKKILTESHTSAFLDDNPSNPAKFFGLHYTTSARIGIVPPAFKNFERFGQEFQQRLEREWFSETNSKYKHLYTKVEGLKEKQFFASLIHEGRVVQETNDINKLTREIKKQVACNQYPSSALQKLEHFTEVIIGMKDIYKELVPGFDILIHELIPEKDSFASMEYAGKYKAFEKIKEVIEKYSTFGTLTAGLMFDYELRPQELIQNFLKRADFNDLIFSDENNKTITKYRTVKNNHPQLSEHIFGKKGTTDFLTYIRIADLGEWGIVIKESLLLTHRLNIEDYDTNLEEFKDRLGLYAIQLHFFWKEELLNYHDEVLKPEEIKSISDLLPDLGFYVLQVIFNFSAIIQPDLELYDQKDYALEIQELSDQVRDINSTLVKESSKNPHFEALLRHCIGLVYRFKIAALYKEYRSIKQFALLREQEMERKFKDVCHYFLLYWIGSRDLSREVTFGGSVYDFVAYGYPIECKIRKQTDTDLNSFLGQYFPQITDYCNGCNKNLGFFIYYDDIVPHGPELPLRANIFFKQGTATPGIYSINPPIIICVRIPNYRKKSSGAMRW